MNPADLYNQEKYLRSEVHEAKESNYIYFTLLLCLVLVSIPIKNFAYCVPPLYLLIELMSPYGRIGKRTLILMFLILFVSGVSLLFDSLRSREVNEAGIFVGLFTHLPILIFLSERFDRSVDEATFQKIIRFCTWFVIFQSITGFVQFVISGNADAVCGTFGLFDLFNNITITQVYFTFTIFGVVLFLFLDYRTILAKIAIVMGLMVCILAHSGHQTVFLICSLLLFTLVRLNRVRQSLIVIMGAIALVFAVLQFYPSIISGIEMWYKKTAFNSRSAKWMALEEGASILGDEKNFFLGTGLGQFCSRAGLITTNGYLRVKLPDFLAGKSDYFRTLGDALNMYARNGEGSAISKPYFSLLSLAVELGVVQSLLLIWIVLSHLGQNLHMMRSQILHVERTGFVASVWLTLFILCCGIENYAEFPQAIFLPILLYIVVVSRARADMKRMVQATTVNLR